MEVRQVDALLDVWERTLAPLRDCRSALKVSAWDVTHALAALDAAERNRAIFPTREPGERTAAQVLAEYKELARKHRDAAPGVLPRSLVWVTESGARAPSPVAAWHRHRFSLGSPVERWIERASRTDSLSAAGFVRLALDPDTPRDRESALLAANDGAFIMDRLAAHARRAGTRIAAELLGTTGWITEAGPDDALREASNRLLAVNGTTFADMRLALAGLSPVDARRMLDERADRTRLPGCGGAEQIDSTLRLVKTLLLDIELHDVANDADDAIVEAASTTPIHRLVLARAHHATTGTAAFVDIADRMVLEQGFMPIGSPAWREISRVEARKTWISALSVSQAYDQPLIAEKVATELCDHWIASFDEDALCYRNGDDTGGSPILDNTFERGAIIVDARSVGMLYVGDED